MPGIGLRRFAMLPYSADEMLEAAIAAPMRDRRYDAEEPADVMSPRWRATGEGNAEQRRFADGRGRADASARP
jgi:hypothetical protein